MKYDIYFHNDFDGRASAAVILAFLRSRGDDVEHFQPVDFDLKEQWLDEKFFERHRLFGGKRNPPIIVDFFYHPQAAFWFDHHATTFKRESWRKKFKKSRFRVLDIAQQSCCHLVLEALQKNFGWTPRRHLTELAKWLNVIDGANYKSARQILERKEPALQVANFIDKNSHDARLAAWIINLLANKTLGEIARLPQIKKTLLAMRKETSQGLEFYKQHLQIEGRAAFIDLAEAKFFFEGARYIPYSLHPKILYSVRVNVKGRLYHVGVGANPWRRKQNKINIGELMAQYGGGGHRNVGGVEFRTKDGALRAARAIIAVLNR